VSDDVAVSCREKDGSVIEGIRHAATAAALAGAALLAASCGGGHPATPNSGSDQLTAHSVDVYAACIRRHGVPNFYFRSVSSTSTIVGGIQLGPWVASANIGSPQFQSATKACTSLFPGGAPGPVTERQKEQMLQFAACIRVHGYPTYPDPQFPAGGGVMQLPTPDIDRNSPQFQAAVKTCNAQS
jgi:hypothetical protein